MRKIDKNHYHGFVAQSVEQRTENPRVGSSILSETTIWVNAPLLSGFFTKKKYSVIINHII